MKNKITKILKEEAKRILELQYQEEIKDGMKSQYQEYKECETNIELNEKWSESTFYEDEKWTGMPLIRMNLTEKNLTSHHTN